MSQASTMTRHLASTRPIPAAPTTSGRLTLLAATPRYVLIDNPLRLWTKIPILDCEGVFGEELCHR